jgi:predicted N-acetyltransferase YhbS
MTKDTIVLRPGRPADVDAALEIDDAAFARYADVGITLDMDDDHPMVQGEKSAWRRCAQIGGLVFAEVESDGARVGFFALSEIDGAAYLEQIDVLPTHMRQGIGRQLMTEVIAMSRRWGHSDLVLLTCEHVPWNLPYYQRFGFERMGPADIGAGLAADMTTQARYLPMADRRVAMRKALDATE